MTHTKAAQAKHIGCSLQHRRTSRMPALRTAVMPRSASYVSPGGVAEIRLLLQFPAGELTHVRVPPNATSRPAWVGPSSEWFYITAGRGHLWDGVARQEVDLHPGRCVHIPTGT